VHLIYDNYLYLNRIFRKYQGCAKVQATLAELWRGINLDRLLVRLFSDILPGTNVLNGLENINEPIFLAAGVSDYDCCPWLWKEVKNLPENFTISIFNKSGHWPHYEEPELFDARVKQWIETIF